MEKLLSALLRPVLLSAMQAEAKAAGELALRRAEEEARKAAQQKLAATQARPSPSGLGRGQPGIRVRSSFTP